MHGYDEVRMPMFQQRAVETCLQASSTPYGPPLAYYVHTLLHSCHWRLSCCYITLQEAAQESKQEVEAALKGADMVFVTVRERRCLAEQKQVSCWVFATAEPEILHDQ